MRNKDLKKLLKTKANDVKINSYTNEILNRVDHKVEKVEAPKRRHILGYTLGGGFALVAACLILVLFLFRPAPTPGPTPDKPVIPDQQKPGTVLVVSKREEVLSREVMALGNVIDTFDAPNESSINRLMSMKATNYDELNKIAKEVNKYLFTSIQLLNNDKTKVSYLVNDNTKYDYKLKMVIEFSDSKDFNKTYEIYYDEKEEDPGEVEIDGIIIINDIEYEIEGERKDSNDECELELKLMLSENSYYSVSNETEINENEYEYSYVVDGVVVKGISMEINNEGTTKSTELEITENNITTSFEFTYLENYVSVEYEYDSIECEILVYSYDSYYLYKFLDTDYEIRLDK